jgi:enterochelin esterase-like enzyme
MPPGVWVAAIHAGPRRRQEYGVAGIADYQGNGALAAVYSQFVIKELLPFLEKQHPALAGVKRAFAGFSLGGLSALDIVWQHPQYFSMAGVFSGALWWRSRPQDAAYREERDRIMHRRIRESAYRPGLQFFFECGANDETADRNGNGIIDSIDDTRDLITELKQKGYREPEDVTYLEIPGGRHDRETWGKAMAVFLGLRFFAIDSDR